MVGEMVLQALKAMGAGVGMVFAVLSLFYGLIKLLVRLFRKGRRKSSRKSGRGGRPRARIKEKE
jgi:Na+-transporting methylmalonyl-CoA/oxaloacetate decarboxylase gamma subunit